MKKRRLHLFMRTNKIKLILLSIAILTNVFAIPSLSQAAPPEVIHSLALKLEGWEVEEAWAEIKDILVREPKDPQLLELASRISFHRGDYQEALKLMKQAIEAGGEEEKRRIFALFIEQTVGVVTPFKKFESPHFVITLDEKQDGLLSDYIIDALETIYQLMAQQYGFLPKEKIRVEIFPHAQAFYYASSLSARDIEIGAVGLAKFNKLMLLSPAALVHGYRWLDAITHEYMHYLIVRLTANKAPIWFHEGLAKYEETRWRRGPSYLSPLYQTLLARALADGKLIPFQRMEPSLIRLETPQEVQLAYAQAASAIEFIIAKAGHEGLKEIMKRMATKNELAASESIKDVLGLTFEEFERSWKEFLALKGLKEMDGVNVRRYKIKEGKADEERLDMEEIKSLVARNRAQLADLLKERGRAGAAVLEYRRALAETPDSVAILNRLSSALINIGRHGEAIESLNRAKELFPDHPTTYTYLGQVYLKLKDPAKAKEAFSESIQINPFNPEGHQGLAEAYEMLGKKAAALKEREITYQLRR
ncbi:MAG TPA: tetratricopeptide repeat protein [Thermodesulfobacteriota bacterium]|nr:tetratricopeptide repeat protein [Thermodesulfobacteriota bacterium]